MLKHRTSLFERTAIKKNDFKTFHAGVPKPFTQKIIFKGLTQRASPHLSTIHPDFTRVEQAVAFVFWHVIHIFY